MIFLCPTCTVRTCSWVMICLSGYYPLIHLVGCTSISRPHFAAFLPDCPWDWQIFPDFFCSMELDDGLPMMERKNHMIISSLPEEGFPIVTFIVTDIFPARRVEKPNELHWRKHAWVYLWSMEAMLAGVSWGLSKLRSRTPLFFWWTIPTSYLCRFNILYLLYWNYTVCLSTCLYLLDTFPCFFVRFLQSPAISNFSHQFPVWTIHIGVPHRKALNREHGEMFYYWRQNIPEASFSWYIYNYIYIWYPSC